MPDPDGDGGGGGADRARGEIGSLRAGAFADMIAVAGDPLADVRVLESVAGVIKGGERYR